ncbi:alpha/beta fold hydrolase [Pseudotenacibaculum sp. MALMAid0570]|uniref:alpha/beta hydrolase n=1 Tax=Pseudotenacibaculum sp. MALMAid0570 TaxID=3143938 RepID=UPI0032DFA83D
MKNMMLMVLLFIAPLSYAQNSFSHEREISDKDNYVFSEIDFMNLSDNLKLSGTLIAPKTAYKKVIIILPGSGKDTRNSHYKLAEEFLKSNIAVYRFDERGVGKSQGKFTTAISGLTYDLAYAIKHLRSLPKLKDKQIGVLGHSLGGMASIVSHQIISKAKDEVDFLIQIASPVKSFSDASRYQIQTLPNYQVKNKSKKELVQLLDTLVYITNKNKFSNISDIALREKGIQAIKKKGFELQDIKFWSYAHIDLYKHDYEDAYKQIQVPTIYLIGSNDKYVNPISEVNRLKQIKNPLITIKVMKDLNHYLTSGTLNANVLYNIDKSATDTILNWIQKI